MQNKPVHASTGYGPGWVALLTEPVENLRLLGRRSILALLGIAVGCMAVVAVLNIGHNARIQAMSLFQGMGTDLIVASIQLPVGTDSGASSSRVALDSEALHRNITGISAAAPLIPVNMEPRLKGHSLSATVLGSNAELADVLDLRLRQGRFLSRYDIHSTYAVIGAKVVVDWQDAGVHITPGDRLQIGGYLFEIIGILQPKGHNSLLPISPDDAVIIPVEGMQRIIASPQISSVIARHPDRHGLEQNAQQLQRWLKESFPDFEINIQIPRQLLDGMAQQSRLFSWLLAGLGGIALLSGGIGVMNVMVMNISERRREIGVRMALGARPKDIARLFLLEAIVLATAGAVSGALTGLAASWLFVHFSGWPSFSLSVTSLLLGIGSAMVTGLFFGLSPAIAAAKLSPVQALHDE